MIHVAQVRTELNKKEPVNLKFFKADGSVVEAKNVVCTSSFFENDTVNLKWLDSGEFRKVCMWRIFEINGEEVCL
jgi:hypothetical protein